MLIVLYCTVQYVCTVHFFNSVLHAIIVEHTLSHPTTPTKRNSTVLVQVHSGKGSSCTQRKCNSIPKMMKAYHFQVTLYSHVPTAIRCFDQRESSSPPPEPLRKT